MSEFFLTSNEPKSIKDLFKDEAIIMPMDFDFMLCCRRCTLPVERKAVPGDLLASAQDGRLQRELTAMREVSEHYIVLLHGEIKYKQNGLVDREYRKQSNEKGWTRKGVRNLLRSLEYVEGAHIEWAKNDRELIEIVHELQEYFDSLNHSSLRTRPVFREKGRKLKDAKRTRVINFYQGLPECKYGRAKLLYDAFPNPTDLYKASVGDIYKVKGFGEVLSQNIYDFLRTGD